MIGREGMVKLLLGTGRVDVNSKDAGGRTPFTWATMGGRGAVVWLLLEASQEAKTEDSVR